MEIWVKMVFWVKRDTKEVDKEFEKLSLCAPLKTESLLISWDIYSQSSCEYASRGVFQQNKFGFLEKL